METVSVKFQEDVLKKVDDKIAKHNFNSRTEFIREAVRDKLKELTKEELMREVMKFYGKGKRKTSSEEELRIKAEAGNELREELERRFHKRS
jgi:metal-responsive CopG/Arc/MetJ family transcriptional regulator